jgi:diaminopimelate decarboxylase
VGARVSGGRVQLDGIELVGLARRYGTPLYVYHAPTARAALRAYRAAFAAYGPVRVAYSVKACGLLGVLRIFRDAYASVASVGELEATVRAGIDPRRAWLHGNAKTEAELRAALRLGVGRVVLDGPSEIARLDGLARRRQDVWLRVSPGIAAETHAHLRTGTFESKFGFRADRDAVSAARAVAGSARLRLTGLHAHIGSQIRDLRAFRRLSESLIELVGRLRAEAGLRVSELCVGGGLAAPEVRTDRTPDLQGYARAVCGPLRRSGPLERAVLAVEPGRSLVGRAAVALYTVVDRKPLGRSRAVVSVDGGMGDNVRPALYAARYEAVLAGRVDAAVEERVSLAGAYCEEGDMLIEDVALPRARPGDIVAVPAVGAYALAMSSNYNMRPRPAVVLIDRGRISLIRRRERSADLFRLERPTSRGAGAAARPAGRVSRAR